MSILERLRAAVMAAALTSSALVTATLPAADATTAPSAPSASPAAGAVAAQGTLAVTPAVHVGGQALTFSGKLPQPGRRQIRLEHHMNRPGDVWREVPGTRAMTKSTGAFRFRAPAPAMFNISYRVAGGGLTTEPYLFYARPQAVTLSVNGQDQKDQYVTVPPLLTYTVTVDSAADIYTGRDLKPPVFAGRTITLQERVNGHQWATVGTASASSDGLASFPLTAALLGERVLRARAENVTANGHRIGWTTSWPTYVRFSLLPDLPLRFSARSARSDVGEAMALTGTPAARHASTQYGWYRPRYDFDWEYGESLSSPPGRGEVLKGTWLEASSGSGRVVLFNGALAFQSKLNHKGAGDRGTTSTTLSDNAQKYGRWEFQIWQNVFEQDGLDYRMRVELVPAGTAPGACATEAIKVAELTLGEKSFTVGRRSAQAKAEWRYTRAATTVASGLHGFGVEVAKDHITWFYDSRAFATMKTKAALAARSWVPRVSLIGSEDATEYNGSQFSVDWVRAWSLETGREVRSGRPLTRSAYSPTC